MTFSSNPPHPHWRALPKETRAARGGFPFFVRRVGDRWNPETGVLAVDGLTDVSNTEEGARFLATPVAEDEPPILRLYLADVRDPNVPKPGGGRVFFALMTESNGETIIADMDEYDLDHPAM